jgi:hypothetical protein
VTNDQSIPSLSEERQVLQSERRNTFACRLSISGIPLKTNLTRLGGMHSNEDLKLFEATVMLDAAG